MDFTLPPSLVSLRLHKLHGPIQQSQVLPNLEILQYTNCLQGPNYLTRLLDSKSDPGELSAGASTEVTLSRLRTLRICGNRWTTSPIYNQIFRPLNEFGQVLIHPRLRDLEALSVQSVELLDDDLEVIALHYTRLKFVRVADSRITGYGIKLLIHRQKLQWLELEHCEEVSSDAIEWAQSQGVTVKKRYQAIVDSGRSIAMVY